MSNALKRSKVSVDVFVDFLCPYSAKFQSVWGDKIRALEQTDYIDLTYSPLDFIDRFSKGTRYSTRSAGVFYLLQESLASNLANDKIPEQLWQFIVLQFTRGVQPHEADRYEINAGSNKALADHIRTCGFDESLCAEVETGSFTQFEQYSLERTNEVAEFVSHVPSVFINGMLWNRNNLGEGAEVVDCLVESGVLKSDFEADVLRAMSHIPGGEVRTYAELAIEAGHPNAARAVGTVCKNNPLPLIIPCHRVVSSEFRAKPGPDTVGAYSFEGADKWELLKGELGL